MYTHDKKNKSFAAYLKRKVGKPEGEQQETDDLPVVDRREPKRVQVFDVERMEAIAGEHSRNSNLHRNHKRLISLLDDTNGNLPLAELPPTIFDDLDLLRKRFPNFSAVVEFYKQEFALAKLTNNPILSAQPLLILGPPGVGKTVFCHELAKIVDTHFEFIGMSSMTAGFVLAGNSSKWAEGSSGKVVQSLVLGKRANPLLLLDEVDKIGGDTRYSPLGSLYSLLEKETAEKFVDESLEMPIDASHVVWIATANYIDRIPEPILSRFAVIPVRSPNAEQMVLVLHSVYTKVRQNNPWGDLFQEELSQRVADKLVNAKLEPRLLKKILVGACGRAVLRTSAIDGSFQGKLEIIVTDLNIHQVVEQTASKNKPSLQFNEDAKESNVVIMPIFNIPALSNDQNSEETIILWAVYEITDSQGKYHHLAGYIPERKTGRVTSPIKQFDKKLMQLKTSSGRVYKLEGPPSLQGETRLVWEEWKEKYCIQHHVDVTHQYFTTH